MRLIKLANGRFRIEMDKISYEGTLDDVSAFIADLQELPEEEFEEAVCDMAKRGATCALFGLHVAKSYAGVATYGFMCSIRTAA